MMNQSQFIVGQSHEEPVTEEPINHDDLNQTQNSIANHKTLPDMIEEQIIKGFSEELT